MFEFSKTSEIIDFLNSIIKSKKVNRYKRLYEYAVEELEMRCDKMAILYRYRLSFLDDSETVGEE